MRARAVAAFFLVFGALGDAGINAAGVGIATDGNPGGLREQPAQDGRALLADVSVDGRFHRTG